MPFVSPDIASILRPTALAMLVALAGCAGEEKFPPACPDLNLVPEAADLTLYRPGSGRDVTDMGLQARITAVPAVCSRKDAKTVAARMSVSFAVSRGPAAVGRDAVVPYFVGVTGGERILTEEDFLLKVRFPPNIDTLSVNGEEFTVLIPVSPEKSAAAYQIFAGFRLTPEQLAANRAHPTR